MSEYCTLCLHKVVVYLSIDPLLDRDNQYLGNFFKWQQCVLLVNTSFIFRDLNGLITSNLSQWAKLLGQAHVRFLCPVNRCSICKELTAVTTVGAQSQLNFLVSVVVTDTPLLTLSLSDRACVYVCVNFKRTFF